MGPWCQILELIDIIRYCEIKASFLGVVKTTYRLSAHFSVEIFPQI